MRDLLDLKPLTKLPFKGVILPTFDISPELRLSVGTAPDCDSLGLITHLCRKGWRAKVAGRIERAKHEVYAERVRFELDTIKTLGFTDYLLMVWDICRYADEQGIPRGPGRGSVSSSLVCSLLNLTELDPIEHGLFFTRFLSKARAKKTIVDGVTYMDGGLVPDVDMDFSHHRRDEIFAYVTQRYPGQTSLTLNAITLTSKSLIMEMVKIYEEGSVEEAQAASNLIEKDAGIPEDLEDALSDDPKKANVAFKEWSKSHRDTVEMALEVSGLNKSEGKHASALLISAGPIDQLMPLQRATDDEGVSHVVSGYDMYSAQEIALKFDLLGLKSLDVIKAVCDRIGIQPQDIDVHHPSIYAHLADFKQRYGIFQLETFAQGMAATKVKPRDFEQLAAVLAIARPGAFAYLDQFVAYVNQGTFTSIHPLIDDILRPTGGVCVYQEQYLAMLKRIGMHEDRAENARKVLGKKLRDKVPEVKAEIAEVCAREGHPSEIVDLLLKIAEDAGGYGFAKAHAFSYAIITARTIYLKVHHTTEFWWATLQMNRHESKKYEGLAIIEREMRATGYTLLPPDLVRSSVDFTIESPKAIRFALSMIRGVKEIGAAKIELFRGKPGTSKFALFQAMKLAGLDMGKVASIAQAGCLADYEVYLDKEGKTYRSRSRLVLEICIWCKNSLLKDHEREKCLHVGALPEVQWDVIRAIKYLVEVARDEKDKPLIKPSRYETIKKHSQSFKEIYEQNHRNERLANFWYETHVLGYSHSESLRSIFSEHTDGLISVAEASKLPKDSRCRIIGFVSKPVKGKTKKGNDEVRFILTDDTGEVRVKAFNEKIDLMVEANGRIVIEGDICICRVKVMEGGTCFSESAHDSVAIQTAAIYLGLSDLKAGKAEAEKAAKATV